MCEKYKIIIFYVILLLNTSCDNKPVDRNAFKEEMEDREIMRVTAGQLSNYAFNKGILALDSINKIFQIRLDSAISKNVGNQFCNINNIALITRLNNELKINVSRLSKNKIADTTSKLYSVYDAYQYNASKNENCLDNLQKIDDKTLILTRAIILSDQKCIDCHSKPNSTAANQSVFNKKKGELLAIWALEMPKKELIKKITIKDLKTLKE
ncbi:MAG: hypothetical protein EAZ53_10780 [Bacteroidetes bacterium]|nr:MAG: hypothetical protein EAZ53_10780 [Bacteroidota bacterium]